jgi:hypothetical protein
MNNKRKMEKKKERRVMKEAEGSIQKCWHQIDVGLNPALPLTSCVTLGKLPLSKEVRRTWEKHNAYELSALK